MDQPTNPLRIAFAGTPQFAATHLESLLATPHRICAVYTQPDRPSGRGRKLTAGPVKQLALSHHLTVHQPNALHAEEEIARLKGLNLDLMIVVAYGLLLKQNILDIPKLGCLNVHASLLPRWRGAAPIQRAIIAGDNNTGVSIMKMVKALDAGEVLASTDCPIEVNDTAASLHDKLATLGAKLLPKSITDYQLERISGIPQDETQVTYASKLTKQEAQLDWQQPALSLSQKIRAFNPWPIAFTKFKQQPLRIHEAQPLRQCDTHAPPGTVIAMNKAGIDIATGEHEAIRLKVLQNPGKKPLSVAEFLNGTTLSVGDTLQ